MEIHKARSIGELLADFIHGSALEQPLLERKVVELWPEVLGPTVAQLTGDIEVKNGVLYVPLNAAAFVADLHYHSSPDGTSAILSPKAEAPEGEDGRRLFEALERAF